MWTAVALFVLAVPAEALVPVLIVVGLPFAGGLFFGGMPIFDREALETEPGDADVFRHRAPKRAAVRARSRRFSFHSRARGRSIGEIDMQSQV
ncbi:hypothetical protein [Streptomyces wuyuanensis]|uniref:hypothetical protein n=1 Tax=Streptomyces wuyuanensis TaxID=1196353 RepID=UPI003715106A